MVTPCTSCGQPHTPYHRQSHQQSTAFAIPNEGRLPWKLSGGAEILLGRLKVTRVADGHWECGCDPPKTFNHPRLICRHILKTKCHRESQSRYLQFQPSPVTAEPQSGATDPVEMEADFDAEGTGNEAGSSAASSPPEANTVVDGQHLRRLLYNGTVYLIVNETRQRVICGLCSHETTQKNAWRHLAKHRAPRQLLQPVRELLSGEWGPDDSSTDPSPPQPVAGMPTIQGLMCSACRRGYRNLPSFRYHVWKGCPGTPLRSELQQQLEGNRPCLVPVATGTPPATDPGSVQAIIATGGDAQSCILRAIANTLNCPRSAVDLSPMDDFYSEVNWKSFLVVNGSLDRAMELLTRIPDALYISCKEWLSAIVQAVRENDFLLKRLITRVRYVWHWLNHAWISLVAQ